MHRFINIKNKKVIIMIGVILIVLIGGTLALFLLIQRKNEIEYPTPLPYPAEWVKHYQNKDGYRIIRDSAYIPSDTNFPTTIQELGKSYPAIPMIAQRLGTLTITEFINELRNAGIEIKDSSLEYFDMQPTDKGMLALYTKKGGYLFFYHNKSIVEGVLIDYWQFSGAEPKYDKSNSIDTFISKHRDILGAPQVKIIDPLYENKELDFYFDKGVGFADQQFILFKPSQDIDENIMISFELEYFRNFMGCKYCEFREY